MADSFGASFAPTEEQARRGPLQGQLNGIPAALQILAMRLPKFIGARGFAPDELFRARGAQGIDPVASAVLATMARAMAHSNIGLPGGTAGPNVPTPGGPVIDNPPGPEQLPRPPKTPRILPQEPPFGGDEPEPPGPDRGPRYPGPGGKLPGWGGRSY